MKFSLKIFTLSITIPVDYGYAWNLTELPWVRVRYDVGNDHLPTVFVPSATDEDMAVG